MLHFSESTYWPLLELRLVNTRLQKSNTVRYLELVFDQKLNWKAHLRKLKPECNWALSLMQRVSSTRLGASLKTFMMIYRSLVRSKLHYGCIIVYNSANCRDLLSLESVTNEDMRIPSGCFKSIPTPNLQVITEEPPLKMWGDKLSLKYYYNSKSLLQNPVFIFITQEHKC